MSAKQQPQYFAAVDWSNPLTRGLQFAYLPGTKADSSGKRAGLATLKDGTTEHIVGTSLYMTDTGAGNEGLTIQTDGPLLGGLADSTIASIFRLNSSIVFATSGNGTAGDGQIAGFGGTFYSERAASGNDIYKLILRSAAGAQRAQMTYRNDANQLSQAYVDLSGINDNAPHLMVGVRNSTASTQIVYVDGHEYVSSPSTYYGGTFTDSGMTRSIGYDVAATGTVFPGFIDLVVGWNRALTQDEIERLWADPWQIFAEPRSLLNTQLLDWAYIVPPTTAILIPDGVVQLESSALLLPGGVVQATYGASGYVFTPSSAELSISAYAPEIPGTATIGVDSVTLSVTTYAPTANVGYTFAVPDVDALVVTGYVPTVAIAPATTHRYWRIYVSALNSDGVVSMAEVRFYDQNGNNVTTGGTPSASSELDASHTAAEAFDGDPESLWHQSGSSVPQWLAYDFGTAVEITSFHIQSRYGSPNQAPKDFKLQYSDNGTDWSDSVLSYTGQTGWDGEETRTYPPVDKMRWRVYVTAVDGGGVLGLAEMDFKVLGVVLSDSAAFSDCKDTYSFPSFFSHKAFDNDTGTIYSGNTAPPAWISYDFGRAVDIDEVTFTARSGSDWSQSPKTFTVDYLEDDRTTWVTKWSFTDSTGWTTGLTRSFLFKGPDSASLNVSTYAPTIDVTKICSPAQVDLTIGAFAPDVGISYVITPDSVPLVLEGQVPLATPQLYVLVPNAELVLTGYSPELGISYVIQPSSGQVVITRYDPVSLSEQWLWPASDISQGSWLPSTGLDLYAMLDEETPNDSDYIYGTDAAGTCEVGLTAGSDPEASTGHVVSYRIKSQGPGLVVYLFDGTTQIASWSHPTPPGVETTYTQELSGAEVDAITDYGNLRLKFEATA